MALPPAILVLLVLCFYTLEVAALPDPRYLSFYGQVKRGPPVQARKLRPFQTFDSNSVCTLASQQQPSLNGYDYAFCCKEDSPLLDFWLVLSFQTCKFGFSNAILSGHELLVGGFKHVLTSTAQVVCLWRQTSPRSVPSIKSSRAVPLMTILSNVLAASQSRTVPPLSTARTMTL